MSVESSAFIENRKGNRLNINCLFLLVPRTRVNVYEGFMDYISALSYYNIHHPISDSIVLNGVGFVEKFIALTPRYSNIDLYLDNDTAGQQACRRIQNLRSDAVNQSQLLYPNHKDFNEFLHSQPRV